jgi:hypothetical protein
MKKLPIFCALLFFLRLGLCASPGPRVVELRSRPAITSWSGQQITIVEVGVRANQLDDSLYAVG